MSSKLLPALYRFKNVMSHRDFKLICRVFSSKASVATSERENWSASIKTAVWNKAIADAEKIVGYPTTVFSLKYLLSEEFNSVAMHLRKLMGTSHPLLKTAKRLVYNGRTNMQTRGLVVLLLSKAAGHTEKCSDIDTARESGITERQHTLAEITEMMYTAHIIHKGVLNLPSAAISDKNALHDLQLGNKISILSGDYLLANACKGLASLRNCQVVDHVSKSIADFMQAEFLGKHDKHENPLPMKEMTILTWEEKYSLSVGSLMANSCKSTLELAGHDTTLQAKGFELGKNIALAWQVYEDLLPFVDSLGHPPGYKFNLVSLPVIFHLENRQEKIDDILAEIGDYVSNFNFKKLYESIMEDGESVDKTIHHLHQYSQTAEDLLSEFGSSAASKALSNIINSLRK